MSNASSLDLLIMPHSLFYIIYKASVVKVPEAIFYKTTSGQSYSQSFGTKANLGEIAKESQIC